jgi:septum formation protein
VCGGEWFDKPLGLADARVQLSTLRGHTHELLTAACVVQRQAMMWHTVTSARLTMRDFTEAFLDAYLRAEGSAILGSVGSYRIVGEGYSSLLGSKGIILRFLGCRSSNFSASCGIAAHSPRSRLRSFPK